MNLLAKRGGFRHHVRMVTPAFSDCINKLGVDEKDVIPFGRNKAKISLDVLDKPAAPGKLILVSAITPTPSGEGKTTVSIGLAQGLQAIGKKSAWRSGNLPWDRCSAARAELPEAAKAP